MTKLTLIVMHDKEYAHYNTILHGTENMRTDARNKQHVASHYMAEEHAKTPNLAVLKCKKSDKYSAP